MAGERRGWAGGAGGGPGALRALPALPGRCVRTAAGRLGSALSEAVPFLMELSELWGGSVQALNTRGDLVSGLETSWRLGDVRQDPVRIGTRLWECK